MATNLVGYFKIFVTSKNKNTNCLTMCRLQPTGIFYLNPEIQYLSLSTLQEVARAMAPLPTPR